MAAGKDELEAIVAVLPLCDELARIDRRHLGELGWAPPIEQLLKKLEELIPRAKGRVQEEALEIFAERVLAGEEETIRGLEGRVALVAYDYDQLRWIRAALEPLVYAVGVVKKAAAVKARVAEVEARLQKIESLPRFDSESMSPEEREAQTARMRAMLDSIARRPSEPWREDSDHDIATLEIWRRIMPKAIELAGEPTGIASSIVARGLELIADHHRASALHADRAHGAEHAVYAALAQDFADLWLRSALSSAQRTEGLEAIAVLERALTGVAATTKKQLPERINEAAAAAKKLYDEALPAVIEEARAVKTKHDAEKFLLQLSGLPPDVKAALTAITTQAHLAELRAELNAAKRALAALRAEPSDAVRTAAQASKDRVAIATWDREDPTLDPALLTEKPALLEALDQIYEELEAA